MILKPTPWAKLRGLLRLNAEQSLRMFDFPMREDAQGVIFRQYSYLDDNYKVMRKGTFISNYIQPSNPKSEKQQLWRMKFKEAILHWQNLSQSEKDEWDRRAESLTKIMSGYNLHNSIYLAGGPLWT